MDRTDTNYLTDFCQCREVARLLGDSPRTVAYWVRRFAEEGFAGLAESDRPGRPRRLSPEQLKFIDSDHGVRFVCGGTCRRVQTGSGLVDPGYHTQISS